MEQEGSSGDWSGEGRDVGWVGPGSELEVGSMEGTQAQARMPLTTSP